MFSLSRGKLAACQNKKNSAAAGVNFSIFGANTWLFPSDQTNLFVCLPLKSFTENVQLLFSLEHIFSYTQQIHSHRKQDYPITAISLILHLWESSLLIHKPVILRGEITG